MPPARPTVYWYASSNTANRRASPGSPVFLWSPCTAKTGAGMAVAADNRVGQAKPARGLMEILDYATRSHGRAVIVLVVVALLSILPGFFAIPPTDRDE